MFDNLPLLEAQVIKGGATAAAEQQKAKSKRNSGRPPTMMTTTMTTTTSLTAPTTSTTGYNNSKDDETGTTDPTTPTTATRRTMPTSTTTMSKDVAFRHIRRLLQMTFVVIGIVSTFLHTAPIFDAVKNAPQQQQQKSKSNRPHTSSLPLPLPPPPPPPLLNLRGLQNENETSIIDEMEEAEEQPQHPSTTTTTTTSTLLPDHRLQQRQQQQQQQLQQHLEQRRRFMTGSWIGNTWVPPPPWRLYTAKDLLDFYRDKNVVIVGDSLARRFFATFYYVLLKASENENENENNNETNENNNVPNNIPFSYVEDQQKMDANSVELTPKCTDPNVLKAFRRTPDKCLDMPGGGGGGVNNSTGKLILIHPVYCTYHMTQFFQGESTLFQERINMTMNMNTNTTTTIDTIEQRLSFADVVLVSNGAWDEGFSGKCDPDRTKAKSLVDEMESYQRLVSSNNQTTQVVYRTSGFFDGGSQRSNSTIIDTMSTNVMDFIDEYRRNDTTTTVVDGDDSSSNTKSNYNNKLTYVNWGGAVSARSHKGERIKGDHVAHYGLEPRLVLLQMMTNRLMELPSGGGGEILVDPSSSSSSSSSTSLTS